MKYLETFGQLEVSFSDDQKVVTVWKTGGIYTPNPRGAFTFLPIHFHLISVLSGP
jgi:hypothetical protein